MANVPQHIINRVERIEEEIDNSRIVQEVSSTEGYDIYQIYGYEAAQAVKRITEILESKKVMKV
jgi:uncharacterized protein (UPF0335 family)